MTAVAGLSCIASLVLRVPDNSKALFEAGIADIIIECMKLHPDNENVQVSKYNFCFIFFRCMHYSLWIKADSI